MRQAAECWVKNMIPLAPQACLSFGYQLTIKLSQKDPAGFRKTCRVSCYAPFSAALLTNYQTLFLGIFSGMYPQLEHGP